MESPNISPLPPPPPPPLPPPPPFNMSRFPPPPPPFTPPNNQISASNQSSKRHLLPPETPYSCKVKRIEGPILRKPRRTNLLVWFGAILCLLFFLLLILFGIGTSVIFLSIKPKIPLFDTPAASLNLVYLNSLEFLNGDFIFIANFSNPNKKLDVRFESAEIELYFFDSVIATHALQPFIQRRKEMRMIAVHLISSLVYLPPNLAIELQKQVQRNKIVYNIRGNFRVKVNFGLIHYSYMLHGRCQLELTSPPNGVLLAHSCKTKK